MDYGEVTRLKYIVPIEISGFCPDPGLLQHGLAPIPRAVQQNHSCSIHRLPVQPRPFPVFHQTG